MDRMRTEMASLTTARTAALFFGAAVVTAGFSYFGIDWLFYTATRASVLTPVVFAAGFAGFIMPIVVPLSMFVIGIIRKDAALRAKAWAVARAVMYALVIVAVFKALTGRSHPEPGLDLAQDITRQFSFGFFEKGIFWGWPSSHAASSTALAVAYTSLVHGKTARVAAIAYALMVCTGAAIGFHWLSDVLAGIVVGWIAGRSVRRV